MGDGSLSQEEIDALLMGADDMGGGGADPMASMDMGMGEAGGDAAGLSPSEKDILADSFNEAMGAAASSVGTLLGKTVTITNATVDEIGADAVQSEVLPDSASINVNMGAALSCLVFPGDYAKKIAMIMMGADSEPPELQDAHLSTLGEMGNTIISALSNNLGGKFKEALHPSPPDVKVFKANTDLPPFSGPKVVRISYNVNIDGISASKLNHYIDGSNAVKWAKNSVSAQAAAAAPVADLSGLGIADAAPQGVPINPVNLPSLQTSSQPSQLPPNFDLLLDVQMVLTVELGRTNKYVKDILSLGEGSIIELDKLAGEPVDLLINGKLIAKGEVVVIDENFGVRVTDIVGPAERLMQITANQ